MQAPVVRNPFAAAPPPGSVQQAPGPGRGGDANSPTGPILGRGSELRKVYDMPETMGHADGINCMTVVEDKVYTGGRDNQLFGWRGVPGANGGFELVQDSAPIDLGSMVTSLFYDAATKWLFCGLWNGEIAGFCKEPMMQDRLSGHRRSITGLIVHSGVVISGSNDGTVRLWTRASPQARYQCHGQPIQNPTGAITAVRVLGDGLWVGAQNGIACIDLASLQVRGTIPSTHQVTGLIEFQGHMFATFRNGDIKIYDATGNQTHALPSRGEHTSNTAVEIMMHPTANVPMLMCGQQFGYITAYDLPSLNPRGSFVCKQHSDVKAIMDAKFGGMFLTAGLKGDIQAWQWGAPQSGPGGGVQAPAVSSSPFAPGAPAGAPAPSPFAQAPGAGGCFGGAAAGAPCGGGGCGFGGAGACGGFGGGFGGGGPGGDMMS